MGRTRNKLDAHLLNDSRLRVKRLLAEFAQGGYDEAKAEYVKGVLMGYAIAAGTVGLEYAVSCINECVDRISDAAPSKE